MKILNDHTGYADGRVKLSLEEVRILVKALITHRGNSEDYYRLTRDMMAFQDLLDDRYGDKKD